MKPFFPIGLICFWALTNFLYVNRDEHFHVEKVFIFYLVLMAIYVFVVFLLQKAFYQLKYQIFVYSYVALFFLFLTPGIREILDPYMRYRYILLIVILAIGITSVVALKLFPKSTKFKPFLVFTGILAFVPLLQYGAFLTKPIQSERVHDDAKILSAKIQPNVYFIVTDAYMRADQLKEGLGFDNSDMIEYFEANGFQNIPNSYSSYPSTKYSMFSTFDMRYLNENNHKLGARLFETRTFRYFKKVGYSINFMPDLRGRSACKEKITCFMNDSLNSGFYISYLADTLIKTVPLLDDVLRSTVPHRYEYEINEVSDLVDILRKTQLKSPAFFYAHLSMPHSPYIRDEKCSPVDITKGGDFKSFRWYNRDKYIGFLKCGNKQLKTLVNTLNRADPDAIVIIQGDHGAWFLNHKLSGKDGPPIPGPEKWKIKAFDGTYAVLNVMKLPSSCKSLVYPSLSTVNTFKLVFACITGESPRFLNDKSYMINKVENKMILIREGSRWKY